jgi:hypothetical protein
MEIAPCSGHAKLEPAGTQAHDLCFVESEEAHCPGIHVASYLLKQRVLMAGVTCLTMEGA